MYQRTLAGTLHTISDGFPINQEAPQPPAMAGAAKVAILLCTYNGQKFLADQLDSYIGQTHADWQVWASDDGSQDSTRAMLSAYQAQWGDDRLHVVSGPAQGFAANFFSLVHRADIVADYYAYSDQDDIWDADKLERAANWLNTVPRDVPALYCARTRLVDADNQDIGLSSRYTRPASFANALVQNIASGNTMVFNHAARQLLRLGGADALAAIHDWWTYIVVSGCGGAVHYDEMPCLRYRQHSGSLFGENQSWRSRWKRIRLLCQGWLQESNDANIQALTRLRGQLTPESRRVLNVFARARAQWLLPRLFNLWRSGVYRQTVLGNLGLIAAAVLGKI